MLTAAQAPDRASAEALDRAVGSWLRANGDPLAHLAPVLAAYPDFIMGHVLTASVGVAAKDPGALPMVRDALASMQASRAAMTEREFAHFRAAHAWLGGQPALAASRYTEIVRAWPLDLVASRLAQSCHFFLGRMSGMRDLEDTVRPRWNDGMPGYEYFLAMTAFARAENDDNEWAEALGRQALLLEPEFPFAIHAVAHALHGRSRFAQGAAFMREQRPLWIGASRMAGHNAWHSAMFELESGNPERALAILDDALMPRAADSSSDAADATALLWRLGLEGVEAGGRWTTLSDCWAAHAAPGYWPLMDLHAALSFSAAGHRLRTRALERAIAARVGCGERAVSEVHVLTLSGLRAVEAFVDGDHARARRMLVELQPMLRRIGGSHAQLDLFRRMYQEAGSHLRGTGSIQRATLPLAA